VKTLFANPGLDDVLKCDHHISRDLRCKLYQWGILSEAQIELAHKIVVQENERTARQVKREALLAAAPVLEDGKGILIEGTIISTRMQESNYGETLKMLVQMTNGNRVWGTVPDAIICECGQACVKGSLVRFVANVERKDGDDHFGFFKRPRKAEVLAVCLDLVD